jgi:NADH-quinone oxidoreductase subunit J
MTTEITNVFGDILFYFFCVVTVAGALYVLFSKNVLYSAYGLLVTFLGVASMFVFSGAEFMAASQIMVYVGGILVLLIFGIMLSSNKRSDKNYLKIKDNSISLGLGVAIPLFFVIMIIAGNLVYPKVEKPVVQKIQSLGFELMTDSVLALEIVGILLLMALIGATFIAKSDE